MGEIETPDAGRELAGRWALVTPHRESLMAIARRRCPTLDDAEDCVHEAMVRAVAYDKLDPARVGALLTAMVVRISADHARRRGTEERGRPRLATVPAQVATPDEALADNDEARWLAGQIVRLPERERQVFERRVAGLSATETASALRLSYKSVESAFTRARGRMRLWATTASILAAGMARRLRQRQGLAAAALAAVSVGCLLGAGPGAPSGARASAPSGASHSQAMASPGGDARHGLSGGSGTEAVRVGHSVAGGSAVGGSRRQAGGTPPDDQHPKPSYSFRTPPVNNPSGGGTLLGSGGIDVWSSSQPVSATAKRAQRCLADPQLGPQNYGCPPP